MQTPEQLKRIGELKAAIKIAENKMLSTTPDKLLEVYNEKQVAIAALEAYIDEVTPEDVRAIQINIGQLEIDLEKIKMELEIRRSELKELYPDAPELKKVRSESVSRATVSMTVELKAQIISLKKEGKRNNEISVITGLTNGQISPILQKAGLTQSKK